MRGRAPATLPGGWMRDWSLDAPNIRNSSLTTRSIAGLVLVKACILHPLPTANLPNDSCCTPCWYRPSHYEARILCLHFSLIFPSL